MIEMFTGRPPTLAPRGMVACAYALASEAAVAILTAGGSSAEKGVSFSADSAAANFALGFAIYSVGEGGITAASRAACPVLSSPVQGQ